MIIIVRVLKHVDSCDLLWDEVLVLDQFPGDGASLEMWLKELHDLQNLMDLIGTMIFTWTMPPTVKWCGNL